MNTDTKMLYAVSIHVKNCDSSDAVQYATGNPDISSTLLDNAAKFDTESEAVELMEEIKEYGEAAGWDLDYSIYKFEA